MKTVRSVERAISVLMFIAENPNALGLSEISRNVRLDKATTLRLIATLEKEGLVRQEPNSRHYILGPSVSRLINPLHMDIRRICKPHMEQLVQSTGETVCLIVRRGLEHVIAEAVSAQYELCMAPNIGSTTPVYAGASGKCILAFSSDDEVDHVIKLTKLKAITKDTITNPQSFRRQLAKIRRQGYAISQGEIHPGGAAVAAPIFDRTGEIVAAIDLRGPQLRLDRVKLNQLSTVVLKCANAISSDQGFERQMSAAQ